MRVTLSTRVFPSVALPRVFCLLVYLSPKLETTRDVVESAF